MSLKTLCLVSLCVMVGMTGCAESLEHYHRGNKIVERHYIPGSWSIPGDVSKTECRSDQMVHSVFWGKKVCPDTIEPNAPLAIDRGSVQTASYKDLVIPATITGLFQVAAFGTLGAVMPKPVTNVNQTTNALPGARFSTGYFNATPAPAWLGQ